MTTPPKQRPTTETWPEGVFARYLTVGGATVDLSRFTDGVLIECGGCPNWSTMSYYAPADTEVQRKQDAVDAAARQAQEHAERCRALPRPQAT
jgi:pyruvate-formate lyase-activating enzyme